MLELGAGLGTVAAALPPSLHRTLVELDPALVAVLRRRFPADDVREADALAVTDPCDVLLTNLPGALAAPLLAGLADRTFRTALLTLPPGVVVPDGEHVVTLAPGDFRPPQEGPSHVWRVRR